MSEKIVNIAIDGPSGSGKSTLAKRIAAFYGYIYIDTGALYRTIGLFVQERGIASDDKDGIVSLLPLIDIDMRLIDGAGRVFLSGKQVGDEIRTPLISRYASDVSKIPEVRAFLLELQQSIARTHSVVMDGRDIGTVILPNADVKIFLTASDEIRAMRRWKELIARGENITYEDALKNLRWRDGNDSNRSIAPAVPAADAILLDNSPFDADGTLNEARKIIDGALK